MPPLDSATRRALRAQAHHLDPVVSIGHHGLTAAVIHEIDVALKAHELIKVRVFDDDRDARAALLEQVCAAVDAAPVQHLGKLFVIWRPEPEAAVERREGKPVKSKPREVKRPTQKRGQAAARLPAAPPRAGGRIEDDRARASPAARARSDATASPPANSRRRRGGEMSRTAPPAGVPRAALPRRRRARG